LNKHKQNKPLLNLYIPIRSIMISIKMDSSTKLLLN